MIELYLIIRFLILRPLGLIKPDPEVQAERDWLTKIGYFEYLKDKKRRKKL